MEQIEASIARYLSALDTADREDAASTPNKTGKLKEKIEALKQRLQQLKEIGALVQAAPDQQISLTEPDTCSMATSGKGNRRRGLQCPDRGGRPTPPDRRARGHHCRE